MLTTEFSPINEKLAPLIEKGYEEHCNEINELIQFRLSMNLLEYFELLVKSRPDDLNEHCEKNAINLLCIDNELKSKIALEIIENDIKIKISEKKAFDNIIGESFYKTIKTRKITNGIENCAWFKIFGSPVKLSEFVKNSNAVLEKCDKENKLYDWIANSTEKIKANWKYIDPREPIPNREDYWGLFNQNISQGVNDFLVKDYGN